MKKIILSAAVLAICVMPLAASARGHNSHVRSQVVIKNNKFDQNDQKDPRFKTVCSGSCKK